MRRALLGAALAAALAGAPMAWAAEPAPPSDSLDLYLRDLSDSTDAWFGDPTARFDTTGLDSLFAAALLHPLRFDVRHHLRPYPVLRYHRSEGAVVGAGAQMAPILGGMVDLSAAYGFSSEEGRYAAGWRRTLWRKETGRARDPFAAGRIGAGTRLDVQARYARETLPFMPEHAGRDHGSAAAFLTGRNRQSVYQQRGVTAGLELWTGDWRFRAGFRHALDQPMPVATRYSVFGNRDSVPENTLAVQDEYSEALAGIAFLRRDWDFAAVLDGRDGGGDRWRLRGVVGKGLRIGDLFHASFQVEAGAAAAGSPRQRHFELGGARAIPSSSYGAASGDHLLLGKAELIYGRGLLGALGIGHPPWLVLQPFGYFQSGAVWDAGRDVVFSEPPKSAFMESAGFGLALRAGVPEPDTYFRLYAAFPVGENAGVPRIRFAIRSPLDLVGKL